MATQFFISAIFRAVDKMTAPIARMKANVIALRKETDKKSSGLSQGMNFGKEYTKASNAWGRIDNRMKSVATTAVTAGTMIGYAFGSTIMAGAELEQTIINATSKLDKLTDKGGRKEEAFRVLRDSALEYGRTTAFSAQEVAEAYSNLAQSGYNRSTMLATMPILVKAAAVAETDLAGATDMVSNTMGQFGMEYDKVTKKLLSGDKLAANMTHVANVLTTTADISRASIKDIYESITESGVVANISGVSLEKYAAMLGVLAQAGIKQSVAGTGLKNIFVRLKNPVAAGRKELAKFGLDLDKFTDLKDPMEQFGAMFAALEGKSDKVKQGFLDKFFGKIPLADAMVLFREGPAQVHEFYKQIMNSQGALDEKYAIVSDSMLKKIKMLGGALMSLGAGITEGNKSPIEDALEGMTTWINTNSPQIIAFFKDVVTDAKVLFGFLWDHRDTVVIVLKGFVALKMFTFVGGTVMDSAILLRGTIRLIAPAATFAMQAIGLLSTSGTVAMYQLTGAAQAALVPLAAISVALGGIALAYAANENLKSHTEGMGIMDIGWQAAKNFGNNVKEMTYTGKMGTRSLDPAKIVDAHQNSLARQRFDEQQKNLMPTTPGAPIVGPGGVPVAPPPVNVPVNARLPKEVLAEVKIILPKGASAEVSGGGAVPGLVIPKSGGL